MEHLVVSVVGVSVARAVLRQWISQALVHLFGGSIEAAIFIVIGAAVSRSGGRDVVVGEVVRRGALDGVSGSPSRIFVNLGGFFQHNLGDGSTYVFRVVLVIFLIFIILGGSSNVVRLACGPSRCQAASDYVKVSCTINRWKMGLGNGLLFFWRRGIQAGARAVFVFLLAMAAVRRQYNICFRSMSSVGSLP